MIVAAVTLACSGEVDTEKVSIRLNVNGTGAPTEAKSFLPNGLAISTIKIDGEGPEGLTTSAQSATTRDFAFELEPGSWKFQAQGLSKEGLLIAAGFLSLELSPGEKTTGTIVLLPAQGSGCLALSWSLEGTIAAPLLVEGSLKPVDAQASAISCAYEAAPFRIESLAAGSYELELRLISAGVTICGLADRVLIAAGMETQATVLFEPPAARLGLQAMAPDFSAVQVAVCPARRRIASGQTAVFRAATAGSVSWHLDGSTLGGTATELRLPATGETLLHRLDCLASGPSLAGGHGQAFLDVEEPIALTPFSWVEAILRSDEDSASPAYAKALGDCRDLAWSADGAYLAAVGKSSNAITLFEASTAGALFVASSIGGASEPRLIAPSRLCFLPDGGIFAISDQTGAAYTLGVSAGSLAFHCAVNDPILAGAADLALAEGGSQAYIAAPDADAIALLKLGLQGELGAARAVAIKDSGTLAEFSQPACLALDPTASLLVVGTQGDDALYFFTRSAPSGDLSLSARIDKSAFSTYGSLSDPCSLAFSPDGSSLFVLSYYGKAVFRLDKDPSTGSFSPRAGAKNGSDGVEGFASPKRIALSPNGDILALIGGGASDGLATFDIALPGTLVFRGALLPGSGLELPSRPAALAFSCSGPGFALAADGQLSSFIVE